MPDKLNPAMAEMLSMLCYHVIGHDTAIAFWVEARQLEVNVTMPYVAYALLESLELLANGVEHFDEKAVRGLEPHEERMRDYAERSCARKRSEPGAESCGGRAPALNHACAETSVASMRSVASLGGSPRNSTHCFFIRP
jgi:hypothetical protein